MTSGAPGSVSAGRSAVTRIREARLRDASLLPAVERSAGMVFRTVPDLAWLADSDGLPVASHRAAVRRGTAWVVTDEVDDAPFGFLTAELIGLALHILELAVRRERQGAGHGRSLVVRAVEAARARRLSAVTLTTFRDVEWNEPFYARLGFEMVKAADLTDHLKAVLAAEAEHGLPIERRCAMRLSITRQPAHSQPMDRFVDGTA